MRKIISWCYILMMAATLALVVFAAGKTEYYLKPVFACSNLRLLLPAVLLPLAAIFLLARFGGEAERFCRAHTRFLLPALLLVLFLTELLFVRAFFFYQDWDPLAVLAAVYHTLHGEIGEISVGYFSAHPNNLALVALYLGILRLAGLFGSESVLVLVAFQCLLLTFGAFLVFRILRDEGCPYLSCYAALLFYSFWIGLSPWIVTTYSDMTGLIFPLLFFRLFQLSGKKRFSGTLPSALIWALTGILGALGYAIKPQSVIFALAALFLMICRKIREQRTWGFVLLFGLFFLGGHFLLGTALSRVLPVELDKSRNFSAVHYFMMGLNEETSGVYSNEDTEYTASFEDPKERRKADAALAKERLCSLGLSGLGKHLGKKQLVNFSDGMFAWGIDGNFFAGKEVEGLPAVKATRLTPLFESWLFPSGEHYLLYSSLRQSLWLGVLFFGLIGGIWLFAASDSMLAAALSVMGLTVFELLFEAKARYLLIETPVFLILAFFGVSGLFSLMKKRQSRQDHESRR